MWFYRSALCLLAVSLAYVGVGLGRITLAQDSVVAITPEVVLQALIDESLTVKNAAIECVWYSKTLGSEDSWEEQSFRWDGRGHRRMRYQSGPVSKDGQRLFGDDPIVKDIVFDGGILAYLSYHPRRNRFGLKLGTGDAAGYNSAIIGNASSPLLGLLKSLRNPLEYMSLCAISAIREGIADGTTTVRELQANNSLEVVIDHGPDHERRFAQTVIEIDTRPKWRINRLRSFDKNGEILQEVEVAYGLKGDMWIPINGRHVIWGDREQYREPPLDWRFEVTMAVYNDPNFDERAFEIKLEPDTAVSDTRHDVTYRIGEKGASDIDLDAYVQLTPLRNALDEYTRKFLTLPASR